jgi:hypothetical protein
VIIPTDDLRILALHELNLRHRLASKIAAEPHLEAIITEFVNRLIDGFGSLAATRDQVVLDIACGSNSSRSPVSGQRTAAEPLLTRE